MEQPKLIVFDLNKTLIEENSWLDFNVAMGVTEHEDEMLVQWGKEGIITDAEGQTILCSIYKKRGNPSRENITRVLERYTFREGAEATIAELQTRGYRIALVSGSMDMLVEQVAKRLGISDYVANNAFIFDENDMLARIDTIDNDSDYKLDQLKRLCEENAVRLTECMTVGDGANDALLFGATKCGVTFHDSPIREQAKYTIVRLQELLGIVG